jgi:hypothetical protein
MKFAKYVDPEEEVNNTNGCLSCRELEEELVPEWRAKYLNYKASLVQCNRRLKRPLLTISHAG